MEYTNQTFQQLMDAWANLEPSPTKSGTIEMIVRRPAVDEREHLQSCELSTDVGVVGDNWQARGSASTSDGSANPEAQITLMNSRIAQLIAQDQSRWDLAGDQFFVDFDLSMHNLPTGTQINIGTAILEISETPHTGCDKFARRYGAHARKFVMTDEGKQARLRGVNARVIQGGTVQQGDVIEKRTPTS
jgi:hypothetical protein